MPVDPKRALSRTTLLVQRELYPEASDERVVGALSAATLRLRSSPDELASPGGQSALIATFICCAELGVGIELDLDEVVTQPDQPPLAAGGDLAESLGELARQLIQPVRPPGPVDIEVVLGATPVSSAPAEVRLRLVTDDWSASLDRATSVGRSCGGRQPFGALIGAASVAAEIFRRVARQLAIDSDVDPPRHHPVGEFAPVRFALPPLTSSGRVGPGPIDFISAGAITHSALFTLARVPGLAGRIRIFDSDLAEDSNLNRYPLLSARHLGAAKVDALAEVLASTRLEVEPVGRRFTEDLATEVGGLAPLVAVGVDHIPSRWVVQRQGPPWLGVGATTDLMAIVSEHSPTGPCAGCLHPGDEAATGEIPTISFVSATAGALLAYRVLRRAVGLGSFDSTVAYPFALFGSAAVTSFQLAANERCPVGCEASRRSAVS